VPGVLHESPGDVLPGELAASLLRQTGMAIDFAIISMAMLNLGSWSLKVALLARLSQTLEIELIASRSRSSAAGDRNAKRRFIFAGR